MAEYHNQSKLRFWCQMVLPLVYDDSLSYMELLNKVVNYLNNCIQDVGNCETNIESLLEAFVNLQDYVNEITEDISPLIEEKIDEMIESGEFGEILADALATVVSPEYDSTESYVPLNYVIKDGQLYCCTANTTGEWDSTKWRETTVGDELNTLMQRVFALNAGQVSFDESATYSSGTVGNKLKNLSANDIAYNSSETYNDATVGKELSNLNGAITKAKSISQISDLGTDSFYFNATANITLTPTDIIPLYSKGVFITTGNDGVLFAITSTGEEITAYRNGSTWINPKKKTSTRLLGKQIAIYGDSWATGTYGSLGASYLTALTGKTVHVSALGMQTMKQTYENLWDSFNADIYIIQAGLNDKVQNIGATEFIKAVKDFVSAIRAVNTNAEIYFITPQMTHVANQYQNCFPNEFYRIILWRLSGIYNFSCINSLKWQDVKLLSDNTHPTAASIPLIANHIINALENYGDEETHDTEFSNLGRENNQLLFYCEGGIFFFLTQNVSVAAMSTNYAQLGFSIGTVFMSTETVTTNRTNGSFTRMYYNAAQPNYIQFSVASLPSGDTFTNNGTKLIVSIVDLQIPINAW